MWRAEDEPKIEVRASNKRIQCFFDNTRKPFNNLSSRSGTMTHDRRDFVERSITLTKPSIKENSSGDQVPTLLLHLHRLLLEHSPTGSWPYRNIQMIILLQKEGGKAEERVSRARMRVLTPRTTWVSEVEVAEMSVAIWLVQFSFTESHLNTPGILDFALFPHNSKAHFQITRFLSGVRCCDCRVPLRLWTIWQNGRQRKVKKGTDTEKQGWLTSAVSRCQQLKIWNPNGRVDLLHDERQHLGLMPAFLLVDTEHWYHVGRVSHILCLKAPFYMCDLLLPPRCVIPQRTWWEPLGREPWLSPQYSCRSWESVSR